MKAASPLFDKDVLPYLLFGDEHDSMVSTSGLVVAPIVIVTAPH